MGGFKIPKEDRERERYARRDILKLIRLVEAYYGGEDAITVHMRELRGLLKAGNALDVLNKGRQYGTEERKCLVTLYYCADLLREVNFFGIINEKRSFLNRKQTNDLQYPKYMVAENLKTLEGAIFFDNEPGEDILAAIGRVRTGYENLGGAAAWSAGLTKQAG